MLVVETIGRIRREHFVRGKSIKEIVRALKVSRNTVRKVLRSGATSFEYVQVVQTRPQLGAWHGDLDRMLSDNQAGPARERLTLIRMFEELRGLGYQGSYDAVRRYAKKRRAERGATTAEAYVPLSFAPGEAYQFDWSHEVVLVNGTTVTVKVAHIRLCHSRMLFVRAYPRETQEMVFEAHNHPELTDRTIWQAFEAERPQLVAISGPFDGFNPIQASVSKTCLVRFDNNKYSVASRAVGRPVEIQAYADRIVIRQDGAIVGEHQRRFGRGETIYDPWHYVPVLARKPGALRNGAPFKDWLLPASLERVRRKLKGSDDGDRLSAEIAEKQARSIKYQLTIAKLPLAKDLEGFDFTGTPINEALVRDLASGGFLAE